VIAQYEDEEMAKQKHQEFGFGTQIRKPPYFDATLRWEAKGGSVYNHICIPRDFGDPTQNLWNLVNTAILCDVATTFYFTYVQK
jgi:hypothetical protein